MTKIYVAVSEEEWDENRELVFLAKHSNKNNYAFETFITENVMLFFSVQKLKDHISENELQGLMLMEYCLEFSSVVE